MRTGQWYVDIPALIAAGLIAYGVVWRKGVKPCVRGVLRAWRGVKHAVEIGANVVELTQEFRPNGGSSLRDTVDRQEVLGRETKAVVDELRAKLDGHLLEAARRDDAIEDLRDTNHQLLDDFQIHKGEDAKSFGELKGGVQALQGALESFASAVFRAADDAEARSQVPDQ